ncbi:MAG TPA: SpoIIE family protein phosphatase [Stackebrandtia sp.]|jgi:PAS domain-containing protein|uniref:SpoIIE family protein phosphatase n=1 Tax=Stackebrandtia sp. TaxID=2023065 RepID=UPI002D285F43|nr:SpoIIE family protein phosphatase [Stackebrandtia sp.]HZE41508.1 SpoIIE family protein phosphatase [Stackebrandtia sp.]
MSEDGGTAESMDALARTVDRLRSERDGLREAMRNRAVIEQAKGMMAERLSTDPEEAFGHLVELSTRSNVKVVELAAAIVARRQPELPDARGVAPDEPPDIPSTADSLAVTALPVDPTALRTELRLIGTRISAATSFDELAGSITVATAAWPAPANVIVMLLEGDGALRLVGAAGLSVTSRSQWDRLPPIENVPIVAAVRKRAPVFLFDMEAMSQQYPVVADRPHEALVAMPLTSGDAVIGALEVTWPEPVKMDESKRSQLLWLAGPAARRCEELAARPESFTGTSLSEDSVDVGLASIFMSALSAPAVLLAPRFGDDGRVVDFDAERANKAASTVATTAAGGPARLLTALPDVGSRLLFPAFAETLSDGKPRQLGDVAVTTTRRGRERTYHVDVRASRVWNRVLVTWTVVPEATQRHEALLLAEEAFGTGAFSLNLETAESHWTPGMYRITGLDPAKGVPPPDAIAALIHPEDQATLLADANGLRSGNTLRRELRGTGALEGRYFIVEIRADRTADGEVSLIRGACRDVTRFHRLRTRLRRERVSAAASRGERDKLRGIATEMLRPLSAHGTTAGFDITGHLRHGSNAAARCWYDVMALPPGGVALVLGEVNGDDPTAAMLLLRHAAIAYALAGWDPGDGVAAANTLFASLAPERTATMTMARLDDGSPTVTWVTAGRSAPVVVQEGRAAPPASGSLGLPLGASRSASYPSNETRLGRGDQILMYTDGLLGADGRARPFDALCEAATRRSADEVDRALREGRADPIGSDAGLLLARRRA